MAELEEGWARAPVGKAAGDLVSGDALRLRDSLVRPLCGRQTHRTAGRKRLSLFSVWEGETFESYQQRLSRKLTRSPWLCPPNSSFLGMTSLRSHRYVLYQVSRNRLLSQRLQLAPDAGPTW